MSERKLRIRVRRFPPREAQKMDLIRMGPTDAERAASIAAGRCGYCDGLGWLTCDGERGRCLCIGQSCWECDGSDESTP